jgi:type VI secretion system secreted protein Hcp
LTLKANGEDIKGESTQTSMGREETIECFHFEAEMLTSREERSGLATGRRQHKPLIIRKSIDKSTPLIAKALTKSAKIDAEFKFFRPNPTGDGTVEHFYTVTLSNGRIAAQKMISEWDRPGSGHSTPPQEEVQFVFQKINWTFVQGGVSHEDDWTTT